MKYEELTHARTRTQYGQVETGNNFKKIEVIECDHMCQCCAEHQTRHRLKMSVGICSLNSTYLVNDDWKVIHLVKSVSLKRSKYDRRIVATKTK